MILVTKQENDILSCLLKTAHSWKKMKGILAWAILFIQKIKVKSLKDQSVRVTATPTVEILEEAQHQVVRMV